MLPNGGAPRPGGPDVSALPIFSVSASNAPLEDNHNDMKNKRFPEDYAFEICYIPAAEETCMRVNCPHCDEKALITSRNKLSGTVTDLYCQCTNSATCSASFVFSLAVKHNLNPPYRTTLDIALGLLNSLPKNQLAQIQRDLFG